MASQHDLVIEAQLEASDDSSNSGSGYSDLDKEQEHIHSNVKSQAALSGMHSEGTKWKRSGETVATRTSHTSKAGKIPGHGKGKNKQAPPSDMLVPDSDSDEDLPLAKNVNPRHSRHPPRVVNSVGSHAPPKASINQPIEQAAKSKVQRSPCPVDHVLQSLMNARSQEALMMPMRPALQSVQKDIHSCLMKTIKSSQNNSMMVIGPPGCGKTAAVVRAIGVVRNEINSSKDNPAFGEVWLSGLLHGEERRAMKHIARQLCETFQISFSKAASCGENLTFLRDMLFELSRSNKSVVFVLEDFHLFMKRSKPTTLYNLLDALQATHMRAAVIGVTCRHDALDLMEKRARSRFSHRKLLVPPPTNASPEDHPQAILRAMMTVPVLGTAGSSTGPAADGAHAAEAWNKAVEAAITSESARGQLDLLACTGCSCQQLASACVHACIEVCADWQAGNTSSSLTPHISSALASLLATSDAMPSLISNLSVLQLYMLVCTWRLSNRVTTQLNFQGVWEEYKGTCEVGLRYEERAAWAAFQGLVSLGVLVKNSSSRAESRGVPPKRGTMLLAVNADEIRRGIEGNAETPHVLVELMTAPGAGALAGTGVGYTEC